MPDRDATGESRGVKRNRWWIVAGMGLAVFMASLDMSVVNLALPEIRDTFGAATATAQWVVLGYLLPLVALALPTGRWLDKVDHRAVLISACAGFAVSSVAAGLAPAIGWLIAARILQGFFGSALMTLIPVLISTSVEVGVRGRAMGLVDTLGMLGLISGPGIGGLIVDSVGWPWIFYLNVPLCAVLVVLALVQLPPSLRIGLPDREATVEAVVLTAAVGVVMIALSLAAGQAPQYLGLGLAAIPLIMFWQRIPVSRPVRELLALPAMHGPLAALAATAAATGLIFYIVPFHLITVLDVSAPVAGATMLAFPLAAAVLAPAAGFLGDRYGNRRIAFAGMVTLVCGLLLLMPASQSWSASDVAWRLALTGAGIGLFNAPNMSAAMSASPGSLLATAAAATSVARQGGFACGPAIATLVWAFSGFRPGGIHAVFLAACVVVAVGAIPITLSLWSDRPASGRTALGRTALGRTALGRTALGRTALGRTASTPGRGRPHPEIDRAALASERRRAFGQNGLAFDGAASDSGRDQTFGRARLALDRASLALSRSRLAVDRALPAFDHAGAALDSAGETLDCLASDRDRELMGRELTDNGPAWIGVPMSQKLRGREGEERQIIRMLHTVAADTSAVLYVEGGWGSGRTRLLREATDTARRLGFTIVDSDWSPGEEPAALQTSSGPPVLVVLDDLHHADPAFARSLRTLPWRLRDRPIAWLLSRRRGAGGPDADRLFACPHPSSGRVDLRPLSPQAVRLLMADCTYGVVTGLPSLLRAVGGNPLLTVELARSLHSGGPNGSLAHPPIRVQASVQRCLTDLSHACRQLVQVGALLGVRFELGDVATLLHRPAAQLLAPLDEAIAADILGCDADRLLFAQELFWRCVVVSLPRPARAALRKEAEAGQITLEELESTGAATTFDLEPRDGDSDSGGWDALNEIERKVAQLVSQGLTNQQIASHVFRSPHTINYHLRQIFRKLDIHSRVELARLTLLHYAETETVAGEAI